MKVEPCPCCGGNDLWVGVLSVQTCGVKCMKCSLTMERETPGMWPINLERTIEALNEYTTAQAVAAWNRRSL